MIPVESNHGPGYVGIISADLGRYPEFPQSMLRLRCPANTRWNWIMGNGLASNRNQLIKDMMKTHDEFGNPIPRAEWIWFIDDDHSFQPELVLNMLNKNVDIVQPVCSTRKPPFMPYAYRWKEREDGTGGDYFCDDWPELPKQGLHEVDAVGSGGMLVRREVLDKMEDPWFEEGKIFAGSLGEDLAFNKKAKDLGFRVFIDTDSPMGHIGKMEVWPHQASNGEWATALNLLHGVGLVVPHDFGRDRLQEGEP